MPYKKSVVSNIYSFPFRDHVVDKLLVPLVDTGSNFSPKKCRISLLPPVRCSAQLHCTYLWIISLFREHASLAGTIFCHKACGISFLPPVRCSTQLSHSLPRQWRPRSTWCEFSPVFVFVFVKSQNHIQILFQILIFDCMTNIKISKSISRSES